MINISDLRNLSAKVLLLGTHPGIIQSMLDYDYMCGREIPSILGIVAGGGRRQERYHWGENEVSLPVYGQINEVPTEVREQVNCFLHVQSARRVLSMTIEALDQLPNLKLGVIFAEQTPEVHSLELNQLAHEKGVMLVGPASVGVLIPGVLKLGAIGGTQHPQLVEAKIFTGGNTAVISTSGGMVNELIHTVTGSGLQVSFALALGGDRFPITSPAEVFELAERDDATQRIVYFGELGGQDEYEIAQLVKDGKVTKPIFAYVAGTVSELFEIPPQFGHAKAMASNQSETATAKKAALREVGATVFDTFAELAPTLKSLGGEVNSQPTRTISERKKRLIVSHLSGDIKGDVQLLGQPLGETIEHNSYASLVVSMLLGKQVESEKLISFVDYVLRLLVDHGPYVSGAMNTIVSARAGKDLVSSLATGILTIGPRFGGAINGAADAWLKGVSDGQTAKDFVANWPGIIPGIGHKKYRIDLPDPRVAALAQFAPDSHRYLDFARNVEKITTDKKGNLILNVDGTIAAILLDLLKQELGYSQNQLQELVTIEFFNALFVLSRSVGFTAHYLDQRRHDEGLLRLSDQEISYLP